MLGASADLGVWLGHCHGGIRRRWPTHPPPRELNLVKDILALAMLLATSPLFVLPFATWAGEKVTVRRR